MKCGVMTSPSNGHPYSMSPFHAPFIHEFKLSNQYPKSLKQLINNSITLHTVICFITCVDVRIYAGQCVNLFERGVAREGHPQVYYKPGKLEH